MLDESANKKTQKLRVGDVFEVRFDSNASTGHEWRVARQDEKHLQCVGEPRFIAPDDNTPGATGFQVFSFQTLKKGQTILKLLYARPWEDGKAPAQTFWVRLDIE